MIYALGLGDYVELRESDAPPIFFKEEKTVKKKQKYIKHYDNNLRPVYGFHTVEQPLISATGWDGGRVLDVLHLEAFQRLSGRTIEAGQLIRMDRWKEAK